MDNLKEKIKLIIGIIIIILGLILMQVSILLTGLLILSGLFTIPRILKKIEIQLNYFFSTQVKLGVVITSFAFFYIFSGNDSASQEFQGSIDEEISLSDKKETYVIAFAKEGISKYNSSAEKLEPKTTYKILKESNLSNIKYTYEIRVSNNKLTVSELSSLALALKERLDNNYERIFISYYLPEQKIGSGAWATSHFDKDLKVMILGSTDYIAKYDEPKEK